MAVIRNRVRAGFYMDSVALMRLSQAVAAAPDVEDAALMIGSRTNQDLLTDSGLLAAPGRAAGANDLILAVRAATEAAGDAALDQAEALLDRPTESGSSEQEEWKNKSLSGAIDVLGEASLALISVPGEFAAREARRALHRGLDVMMFSDNVPIAEERALKEDARARGRLLMGPDCGTAIIDGVPLAFANLVPRGPIGLVAASGTGLQEVTCLIARNGGGISQAIGVGGRDLAEEIGGITTCMAIDRLDQDPATERIVLISKPPAPAVADRVLARAAESAKPFTICFLGLEDATLPANAMLASTLHAAAELALGDKEIGTDFDIEAASPGAGRRWVRGLYSGGTLCAEAQVVFRGQGAPLASNAPIPGIPSVSELTGPAHTLLDLGADEYTRGRPHPMIDPAGRRALLVDALAAPDVAVVLLDVVIGTGAHPDPAGDIASTVAAAGQARPVVVASVCGTDQDPQSYSAQANTLREAGVIVAPSNREAAFCSFAAVATVS
ncbi:MAG: acyl-CoA synthetase FdrA [Alphaproteobacteria bacterium]|nr:acyl-CoA synthetase FdrA [Alphaproteobacteria bacterium]